MYLCSFVLTKEPPITDVDLREVDVGELSDGIFVADELPALVRLGAFVEVALEPEDAGFYAIEVGMTDADAESLAASEDGNIDVAVYGEAPLPIPHADPDWNTPRSVAFSFDISYNATDEADQLLWVIVSDQQSEPVDWLPRAILVRAPGDLPDYVPES